MGNIYSRTHNQLDTSMTDFENQRMKTEKTISDANIIGDTLSVAKDKVKPISIRIMGNAITDDYASCRCNVIIHNNKITKIIGIF